MFGHHAKLIMAALLYMNESKNVNTEHSFLRSVLTCQVLDYQHVSFHVPVQARGKLRPTYSVKTACCCGHNKRVATAV